MMPWPLPWPRPGAGKEALTKKPLSAIVALLYSYRRKTCHARFRLVNRGMYAFKAKEAKPH